MKFSRMTTQALGASMFVAASCAAPVAFAQSATPAPGSPKPAAYDCSGLEGAPLESCKSLNAANGTSASGSASPSQQSASHDCADMSGAALETCRSLNGQTAAPTSGGGQAYQGNSTSNQGNIVTNPLGANAGAPVVTDSSAGSKPASLSSGSGTTAPSSGSSPAALSGGSGKTQSSSGTAPTTGVSGGNAGARGAAGK